MSRAGLSISGQRFGRLVAVCRSEIKSNTAFKWVYHCDCGAKETRLPATVSKSVRNGRVPMCEACRSKNEHRISQGIVYLDVSTKSHPDAIALVDEADLDLVLSTGGRWHAARGPNGLLYVTQKNGGYLHRMLLGNPEGLEVDHISGNGLDNRRQNIRPATRGANGKNTRLYRSNKSGVSGVMDRGNGFEVWAVIGGRNQYVGKYSTLEEARTERRKAEQIGGYHENHGRQR